MEICWKKNNWSRKLVSKIGFSRIQREEVLTSRWNKKTNYENKSKRIRNNYTLARLVPKETWIKTFLKTTAAWHKKKSFWTKMT